MLVDGIFNYIFTIRLSQLNSLEGKCGLDSKIEKDDSKLRGTLCNLPIDVFWEDTKVIINWKPHNIIMCGFQLIN